MFDAAIAADNIGVRRTALVAGIGQVEISKPQSV
jgi:hypothetical protein